MAALLEHTVMPSGGDFTSLDACIDHLIASHANLVTADVYAEVKIDGTWSSADTAAVLINGLTTDATHYLLIYTTTSARHAAVWSTSKYILSVGNTDNALVISDNHVRVDGLQVGITGTSAITCIPVRNLTDGANQIIISNCILNAYGNTSTGYSHSFYNESGSNADVYIYNTIMMGGQASTSAVCLQYSSGGSLTIYNSIIVYSKYGLYQLDGPITAKNVYVGATVTADYTGTITETNCASEDATAGGTNHTHAAFDTDTFVNVSVGTEDFHLAADGLSPLQATGVDTSGDAAPMNFTTDIDGETITGDWCIGVDWQAAGGAYTLTADGGSYIITGQAAGTLMGRILGIEAGSYGITGQDAGVYYGRKISSDAGAYVLTGLDAGLFHNKLLSASAGAYVVTGQDLALLLGRKITAEGGAYVLAGQDVTLIYTPLGGYILVCEGGNYVLTGQDTGLLLGRKLVAEAGEYLISGQDAAVLLGRILSAEAGTFVITGSDASLFLNRLLNALSGNYVITGETVDLVYSGLELEHLGISPSLWASKRGLHKPLGKKWYKPGVRGQRWYRPSEKVFK